MLVGPWYTVRCVFSHKFGATQRQKGPFYEERLTIWRAASLESAIRQAECEAEEYAALIGCEYLGLAQAYKMTDDLGEGAEVFSLIRRSPLRAQKYIDRFFDSGNELQGRV